MIKFRPHRVDVSNSNTPKLYNREIDDFANMVLMDYKPSLLRKPGKISYQHFLESYLGADIEFHNIYTEDEERPILAMTAFETGKILVFDEDEETIKRVVVNERTVVLDNILRQAEKECLALFCALHEGGHILLHWDVYIDGGEYEREFLGDGELCPVVCCRRGDIEGFGSVKKERDAAEWREYHADYFAAALAMPRVTFVPFVIRLLRENNVYKWPIRLGEDEDLDILLEDVVPDIITETYGTSRRAARIKLRHTGFVAPRSGAYRRY